MQGWPGIHGEEGLEWARAKQFRPFPEFFFPQALSSLELVITSFPFFSRPKSLRLGDTWHFHPPERYYKRVALEVGVVIVVRDGKAPGLGAQDLAQ